MSDVLDYVRQSDPRFNDVPDDELTRYIGQSKPEFLQDPNFAKEYSDATDLGSVMEKAATGPSKPVRDPNDRRIGLKRATTPTAPAETIGAAPGVSFKSVLSLADEPVFKLGDYLVKDPELSDSPLWAGAQEEVRDTINGMMTPTNLALMAGSIGLAATGPIAARLVAAAWAAFMTKHAVEDMPEIARELGTELGKNPDDVDKQKVGQLMTRAGITTAFAATPAYHAVKESPVARVSREFGKDVAEFEFPTTKALLDERAEQLQLQRQALAQGQPLAASRFGDRIAEIDKQLSQMPEAPQSERTALEVLAPATAEVMTRLPGGVQGRFMPKPAVEPKPPLANLPRGTFAPEVPETPPEPQRGMTVIEEIRAAGARTKEQVRQLFPQLSREEAAAFRNQAWPETAGKDQSAVQQKAESVLPDVPAQPPEGTAEMPAPQSTQADVGPRPVTQTGPTAPPPPPRQPRPLTSGGELVLQVPEGRELTPREVAMRKALTERAQQAGKELGLDMDISEVDPEFGTQTLTFTDNRPGSPTYGEQMTKLLGANREEIRSEWNSRVRWSRKEFTAAQAAAEELGLSIRQNVLGGMELTPDQIAKLRQGGQFKGLNWEFTDRRPGSPTEGMTFEVPVGSKPEQIRAAFEERKKGWQPIKPTKPAAPAPTEPKAAGDVEVDEKFFEEVVQPAYSADKLTEGKIRAPFEWEGQLRTVLGTTSGPSFGRTADTFALTPADQYKGPTYTRQEIFDRYDKGLAQRGDATGLKITWRGKDYVFTDPKTFRVGKGKPPAKVEPTPPTPPTPPVQQRTLMGKDLDFWRKFTNPNTVSKMPAELRLQLARSLGVENKPKKIVDQLKKRIAEVEAAPPPAPRAPEPLIPADAEAPSTTTFDPSEIPVVEVEVAKIQLSKDVPQFKAEADPETGVVPGQQLEGSFERLGTPPIVIWKRLNGDLEVITGRHRLDLARRSGEKTIPAQIVEEAKGFTKDMALTFDAEANIRDGQGSVADYATYFKHSPQLTEEAARERGLLSRAKGQAGWDLGRNASDDLYAIWKDGKISEAQAVAIVRAAPNNPSAQQIGIRYALEGKNADFISNIIKAAMTESRGKETELDLFGQDDSAMKQMEEHARRASAFQRELQEQIRAVQGAAKRPEIARKMGVDVKDPEAIAKKIAELKAELDRWENWPLHRDLVARVRGEPPPPEEGGAPVPKTEPPKKPSGSGGLTPREEELFKVLETEVGNEAAAAAIGELTGDMQPLSVGTGLHIATLISHVPELKKLMEKGFRPGASVMWNDKPYTLDRFSLGRDGFGLVAYLRDNFGAAGRPVNVRELEPPRKGVSPETRKQLQELGGKKPEPPKEGDEARARLRAAQEKVKIIEEELGKRPEEADMERLLEELEEAEREVIAAEREVGKIEEEAKPKEPTLENRPYTMEEASREGLLDALIRKGYEFDEESITWYPKGTKPGAEVPAPKEEIPPDIEALRKTETSNWLKLARTANSAEMQKLKQAVDDFAKPNAEQLIKFEKTGVRGKPIRLDFSVTKWSNDTWGYTFHWDNDWHKGGEIWRGEYPTREAAIQAGIKHAVDDISQGGVAYQTRSGMNQGPKIKGSEDNARVLTDQLKKIHEPEAPKRKKTAVELAGEKSAELTRRGAEVYTGKFAKDETVTYTPDPLVEEFNAGEKALTEPSKARVFYTGDKEHPTYSIELAGAKRGTRYMVPESALTKEVPKLRPGEKQTGEIFQGEDQPFNLAGETAVDAERLAREKADAERRAQEAKERESKEQPDLFGEGGGAQGAATGTPLAPAPNPVPTLPPKSIRQIITELTKGLKTTTRFGRLRSTKFGGLWWRVKNLIESRQANDLPVVSHEAGHKLDTMFSFSSDPTIATELEFLGDSTRAGSRSSWTPSKSMAYKRGEGMAEFVRYWIEDPAAAASMAPKTLARFEAILNANKDLADVMRTTQADTQLWKNAHPQARFRSHFSTGDNPTGTPYTVDQLVRDLVDDLHYVKMMSDDASRFAKEAGELPGPGGRMIPPSEDPYILARNLRGSYGMAEVFINQGTADFKTKAVTRGNSYKDILELVAGRRQEFADYIAARRAREMRRQGRDTGLVDSDVDYVYNKYKDDAVFNDAHQKLRAWLDSVLRYAVDSGFVTEASYRAMRRMGRDYVPFHRVFEVGAGEPPALEGGGSGRGLNVGAPGSLRRAHGSPRPIIDPLETMLKNAYSIITAAEKSAIQQAIADKADWHGMGGWVRKVANPMEKISVGLEKLKRQLEDAGADLENVPEDLLLSFWRQSGKTPFGENIIRIVRNGKPEYYQLKKELFDTFHALDYDDAGKLLTFLSAPSQLLRSGVVLDPAFSVANALRDTFNAAIINRYGALPFEVTLRGVAAMLNNPQLVAEWAAAGGKMSVEASYFDRPKLQKFLRERITKDLTLSEQAMIYAKSPLTALRWLTGLAEQATRIGEYEIAYKALRKKGMPEGDARRLAAFESRDRQDFAKGGARTKPIRRMAAFWNAGLQGEIALASAFRNRPLRTIAQGVAFVTLAKLAEQAINWNDEDYWDRPQWERDLFFMIPAGKGSDGHTKFARIPTPFTAGLIFGTLPGRFMQWVKENRPEAVSTFPSLFVKQVTPNPMPQVGQVIVSDFLTGKQGYDMFRGRTIVPDSLADLPEDMQWTEQTSLTARNIGSAIGVPPLKVDHIIAGTTGGLGRQVTHQIIDRAIEAVSDQERTAKGTIPGGRFVTTPAAVASQSIEDFYRTYSELKGEQMRAKMGQPARMPVEWFKHFDKISKDMAELRKAARDPQLPKEDRERAAELMLQLARETMKEYRQQTR